VRARGNGNYGNGYGSENFTEQGIVTGGGFWELVWVGGLGTGYKCGFRNRV
jgi:hypothetical protein